MKVYRGTSVEATHTLLDTPVALAVFYGDSYVPRTPSVAVAAGSFVYIYRKFRPYLKFSLPSLPLAKEEADIWTGLWEHGVAVADALSALGQVRDAGASLSTRAQDLLSCSSQSEQDELLAAAKTDRKLTHPPTCITCMDTINRDAAGDRELSCLVLGTEAGQLLILDPSGSRIETSIDIPAVPAHLACHGLLSREYRINIACRDGVIYAVKDGTLMATRIEPGALCIGMVRTDAEVLVGCMGGSLHSYSVKGKRNWSAALGANITSMCRVLVRRAGAPADCCAVALEGGEVRIFAAGAPHGRTTVARVTMQDTVVAMRFGQYGREANTLVLACRGGSLTIKILRRGAQLLAAASPSTATTSAMASGAGEGAASAAASDAREEGALVIPKKTRLYIEQTQREREQAVDMHRAFQRDLCKLRLAAAKAYVKIITDGGLSTTSAAASGASLRLSAEVLGLGPEFKIRLELVNVGAESVHDVSIVFSYKPAFYTMHRPLLTVPMLLPSLRYVYEFAIRAEDEGGAADVVRCHVCRRMKGDVPAVTTVIAMPVAQPPMV